MLQEDIPVQVLQAVVPEENPMLEGNLLDSLHRQLHDLQEMSTKLEDGRSTYYFPVGILLGFMSFALKAAKTSSTGLAE